MMQGTISPSKQVSSFRLAMADIATTPVERLHSLSLSVRWPHRGDDWEFLRSIGHGVVARDDIGRVCGSVMWFPQGSRFATIGMVITSPRLQTRGTAHWMMSHALDRLHGLDLGLNATRAATRLYLGLGFRKEATVYQHQGTAASPPGAPAPAGILRELGPDDLPRLEALDRRASGRDRGALMSALMSQSHAIGLFRSDEMAAFALCRPFGRGTVIGPVVASGDEDAIAVTTPLIAAHQNQFVRLDTRLASGPFVDSLYASGLPLFDTVLSMAMGQPWTEDAFTVGGASVYGLAAQAVG